MVNLDILGTAILLVRNRVFMGKCTEYLSAHTRLEIHSLFSPLHTHRFVSTHTPLSSLTPISIAGTSQILTIYTEFLG